MFGIIVNNRQMFRITGETKKTRGVNPSKMYKMRSRPPGELACPYKRGFVYFRSTEAPCS